MRRVRNASHDVFAAESSPVRHMRWAARPFSGSEVTYVSSWLACVNAHRSNEDTYVTSDPENGCAVHLRSRTDHDSAANMSCDAFLARRMPGTRAADPRREPEKKDPLRTGFVEKWHASPGSRWRTLPLGSPARPARRAATRFLFSVNWGFAAALRKTYQNCPSNPARNYLPRLKKGGWSLRSLNLVVSFCCLFCLFCLLCLHCLHAFL